MPEWVAYLELARLFRWRRMVSAISVFRSGAVGMYDMATLQGRRNGGGGAGLDTAAAGAGGAFDRRRGGLWSYQSPKVQTMEQPDFLQSWARISAARCSSCSRRDGYDQRTGSAPAFNSSQRGQPSTFLPKFGPWECFVAIRTTAASASAWPRPRQ